MSDGLPEGMELPELTAAQQADVARRERLREQLAKGRETRMRNRAERLAKQREVQERRAAKPRVMVEPVAAGRAEPAREVRLPDSEIPTRRRRHERVTGTDLLPHEKKSGWDYQWLPIRVLNQPVDRARIRDFEDNGGWRLVRAADMPSRADAGTPPDAPIEQEAMHLYTRPMSLTLQAREEDTQTAYQQQHDRMRAAANGQSAVRGEEGIPNRRGVRTVPVEISIVGEAG